MLYDSPWYRNGGKKMTTVLTELGSAEVNARKGSGLWLTAEDTERATGWALKPEGFCKDEVCVPVPAGRQAEFVDDRQVNVAAFWELTGKPAVHAEESDVWFLGEGANERNAALLSLEAPNFTLPDLDGNLHSLADFRKMRILLATWASW
jgi:hypothetical protein